MLPEFTYADMVDTLRRQLQQGGEYGSYQSPAWGNKITRAVVNWDLDREDSEYRQQLAQVERIVG